MIQEDQQEAAGAPDPEAIAWDEALNRLRWLANFLRRRGWVLLGSGLGFAGAAALVLTFLYPKTYSARLVLAVGEDREPSVARLLRLPETGYRMLAMSPEVLEEVAERARIEGPLVPGPSLRIRLLNSREVRQEGAARLLELIARGETPEAAASLAKIWGEVLIEQEGQRAEATGRAALRQALGERQARQERRVRDQRVRLEVAAAVAQEHSGSRSEERIDEARFRLREEEALLAVATQDFAALVGDGEEPSTGLGLATTVASRALTDSRLDEVLDRLRTAGGSLSVFLPAQLEPGSRAGGLLVRSILAGLAGVFLGLLWVGFRELSAGE